VRGSGITSVRAIADELNRRAILTSYHWPPRGVLMPRALSPLSKAKAPLDGLLLDLKWSFLMCLWEV
jgi:hypothetical protein